MSRSARRRQSPTDTPSVAHIPAEPVEMSTCTAQVQARDGGVLLLLDGTESSFLDLTHPERLEFEYHQWMDEAVRVLCPEATRAVHLGGAGCALARAWDVTWSRPGGPAPQQVAVEIDARLAESVRQWFDLPRSPRLKLRVGDAAVEVGTLREGSWDVLVRDVFSAGRVPEPCRSEDFVAHLARAVAPGGVCAINTLCVPQRREELGAEIALLRRYFPGVMLISDASTMRGKRLGNVVAMTAPRPFTEDDFAQVDRAVRRLPLPVRAWHCDDRAVPQP